MKTPKMSLANVQGKLSRTQMKKILGGNPASPMECYGPTEACSYYESGTGNVEGHCVTNSANNCVCKGPKSSVISIQCDAAAGGVE